METDLSQEAEIRRRMATGALHRGVAAHPATSANRGERAASGGFWGAKAVSITQFGLLDDP
jgi:hypothetical protein